MKPKRTLKLAYSAWPTGRHASAWRLPEAFNDGVVDPAYAIDSVRAAERGIFDYFFIGNVISSNPAAQASWHNDVFKMEGFTLAAFVAAASQHIGLVVTANTTYQDPFDTARSLVTLDHLSKGRAALNIVLGLDGFDLAAGNYGRDKHPEREDKYRRADEFVAILHQLSDSWDDGWFLDDREGGRIFDESKARAIDFKGEYFSVRGPLNLPRPPQGHIPIVHAGGSEQSFRYGARHADIRFSPFVSPQWNRDYYKKIKSYLAEVGRDPESFYVIPGISFFVGGTDAEAHAKFREVQNLVVSEYVPALLTRILGFDVAKALPSEKVLSALPEEIVVKTAWLETAFAAFDDRDITLKDLFHYVSNNGHMNQPPVVGSGKTVARWIAENFEARTFDGVKLFPPYARQPLDAFVDLVVPELQRLGVARRSYDTSTMRGHFGLDRPANLFADARLSAAA